ncbi:TonB-dependent receptor plug domain-containing protein [Xylophilus sp.]|uniref:TonB-dependent receptor plug domain-containing protein n=1 Tax=Xylophilus sp. TaxID=2653893 RepID=UPI0013BAF6F4|nr:TonB-dependent receptor [Xylophilus sp.]KAF1050290.1 MAG: Colicin I receptor [Xylophilus sp.]
MQKNDRHPAPLARIALVAGIAAGGIPALAQDAASSPTVLDSVIVTGTRAQRTSVQSESPIDVLTARDLQATGTTELATALARLLPSLNFPRPSNTDATDAARPAQLRGLSPDQVLVLVDGKRRHSGAVVNVNGSVGRGSAPVDLNAIPISAIERIEVLRDGASAQYGSDAIAGVINIILRKGAAGGSATLGYGGYSKGDGRQLTASVNTGVALGSDGGWLRITAEKRRQDYTNRSGAGFRDPHEPLYGQVTSRQGEPDSDQGALAFNGELPLGGGTTLYAFGTWSQRDTNSAAAWRTAYTAVGGSTLRTSFYPQGFLPQLDSTTTDKALVVGLRGDAAGWRWDVSYNHGDNDFKINTVNSVNLSLGSASPTRFYDGRLKSQQDILNADFTRDFQVGWLPRPLTVGLGGEVRHERYVLEAGEVASYTGSGAQGFQGIQPQNAGRFKRDNTALYGTLETEFNDAWSASAALRAEHYDDFGGATSGKLSTRWQATPSVALRGTVSTGFRAPSLAQQNYSLTQSTYIVVNGVNTLLDAGTFGVNTAAARALGAQPLKAEKSRNFSLGLLLQPVPEFTTSIDVYQIDIDGRILYSGNLVLPSALQAQLAAQGIYASAARYFTNALDTRNRGIDIVSSYQWKTASAGRFTGTLGLNVNDASVRNIAANPAVLTANGLTLIDRQTIQRVTRTSPKTKLSLGLENTHERFSVRGQLTRYGSFVAPQNDATLDQTFGAKWVLDVSASWRVLPALTLTVGVDNLTDQYPDQVRSSLSSGGTSPYSTFSPFGFGGRFYYARASYTW